jgi:hypothetical protein
LLSFRVLLAYVTRKLSAGVFVRFFVRRFIPSNSTSDGSTRVGSSAVR